MRSNDLWCGVQPNTPQMGGQELFQTLVNSKQTAQNQDHETTAVVPATPQTRSTACESRWLRNTFGFKREKETKGYSESK
jgi:hypothetical protein